MKFNLKYTIQNIFIISVLILSLPYLVYLIIKTKIKDILK